MGLNGEESRLKKIKIPLIVSLVALVLSFLIGLISGVVFSSILMRSVILALIAGVFAFAARELLLRFVPELFNDFNEAGDASSTEAEASGNKVNISIDDPIDLKPEDSSLNADAGASNNIESEDDIENDVEELEEIQEMAEAEEPSPVSEVSSSPSVSSDDINTENRSLSDGEKAEELSELPDLQEFIPAEEAIAGSEPEDFTQTGTGKFDVSADVDNTEIDTNIMAQAVKTVLRRDS